MDNEIPEINELIKQFAKLPGLGPKSAKRIVLKLISNREELTKPIAKALAEVYNGVSRCKDCGSLKSNSLGCKNCSNSKKKSQPCRKCDSCLSIENGRTRTFLGRI